MHCVWMVLPTLLTITKLAVNPPCAGIFLPGLYYLHHLGALTPHAHALSVAPRRPFLSTLVSSTPQEREADELRKLSPTDLMSFASTVLQQPSTRYKRSTFFVSGLVSFASTILQQPSTRYKRSTSFVSGLVSFASTLLQQPSTRYLFYLLFVRELDLLFHLPVQSYSNCQLFWNCLVKKQGTFAAAFTTYHTLATFHTHTLLLIHTLLMHTTSNRVNNACSCFVLTIFLSCIAWHMHRRLRSLTQPPHAKA